MAIVEDWAQEAAEEINRDKLDFYGNEDEIRRIILKHCPMKPDVAYMPVPRCATCAWWHAHPPNARPRPTGECSSIVVYMETTSTHLKTEADFGCVRWSPRA